MAQYHDLHNQMQLKHVQLNQMLGPYKVAKIIKNNWPWEYHQVEGLLQYQRHDHD